MKKIVLTFLLSAGMTAAYAQTNTGGVLTPTNTTDPSLITPNNNGIPNSGMPDNNNNNETLNNNGTSTIPNQSIPSDTMKITPVNPEPGYKLDNSPTPTIRQ